MITTRPEDSPSKTYAEQVIRGLDALEAKLTGYDGYLLTAIDAAFGISLDYYSLAWIVSRQELVILTISDGITPGVHCPHINCEELIVLVNCRLFMGIAAPVFPRKQAPDIETLRKHWMQILFRTDSELDVAGAVAAGVLPHHLLTQLELSKPLVDEMSNVLRSMNDTEFSVVYWSPTYWSPTYCSAVTHAILAYLDHLQERGGVAACNIEALVHFRASSLISNLAANCAPGLELIQERLNQLREEP